MTNTPYAIPKDVCVYIYIFFIIFVFFKKTKTDSSIGNLLFIEEYGFVSDSKIWTEDIGTNKNTAAKTYAHNLSTY